MTEVVLHDVGGHVACLSCGTALQTEWGINKYPLWATSMRRRSQTVVPFLLECHLKMFLMSECQSLITVAGHGLGATSISQYNNNPLFIFFLHSKEIFCYFRSLLVNPILGGGKVDIQKPPWCYWNASHSVFKLRSPKSDGVLTFHCASGGALFGGKCATGVAPGALFWGHFRHFSICVHPWFSEEMLKEPHMSKANKFWLEWRLSRHNRFINMGHRTLQVN